jgi:hypothetical protein
VGRRAKTASKAGLGLLSPSNKSGAPNRRHETASLTPQNVTYLHVVAVLDERTEDAGVGVGQPLACITDQAATRGIRIGCNIRSRAALTALFTSSSVIERCR